MASVLLAKVFQLGSFGGSTSDLVGSNPTLMRIVKESFRCSALRRYQLQKVSGSSPAEPFTTSAPGWLSSVVVDVVLNLLSLSGDVNTWAAECFQGRPLHSLSVCVCVCTRLGACIRPLSTFSFLLHLSRSGASSGKPARRSGSKSQSATSSLPHRCFVMGLAVGRDYTLAGLR